MGGQMQKEWTLVSTTTQPLSQPSKKGPRRPATTFFSSSPSSCQLTSFPPCTPCFPSAVKSSRSSLLPPVHLCTLFLPSSSLLSPLKLHSRVVAQTTPLCSLILWIHSPFTLGQGIVQLLTHCSLHSRSPSSPCPRAPRRGCAVPA